MQSSHLLLVRQPMTPLEIKAARLALGMNQREFAEALRVSGEATVRSWESGRRAISGPATVAIELMLKHTPPNLNRASER